MKIVMPLEKMELFAVYRAWIKGMTEGDRDFWYRTSDQKDTKEVRSALGVYVEYEEGSDLPIEESAEALEEMDYIVQDSDLCRSIPAHEKRGEYLDCYFALYSSG